MTVKEVDNKSSLKKFHALPYKIYRNDSHWIPHLRQDIEKVFNPKKNSFFTHGEIIRWIIEDSAGEVVGRVAAFINHRTANGFDQPTGGLGFFEVIQKKDVAFKLFDLCKNWLKERGMEAMDGPINFGEKDKFWGLMISNFEAPPYYGQAYNPEYYKTYFEEYGFKIYYKQFIFHRSFMVPLQNKFISKAETVDTDPKFSVRSIEKKKLPEFAEDFRKVYNRAWTSHENFKEMSKEQAWSIMKAMKPIMDEDLTYFAYYDNRPIGFYVSIPELNEAFKYVNGNLNAIGKFKFLWHQRVKKSIKTCFGIAFGIDPDFQSRGVEGALFRAYENRIRPSMKYRDLIITWIGDFNPKMIRIIEGLGATKFRELATYRLLFDTNKAFKRAPIIE